MEAWSLSTVEYELVLLSPTCWKGSSKYVYDVCEANVYSSDLEDMKI